MVNLMIRTKEFIVHAAGIDGAKSMFPEGAEVVDLEDGTFSVHSVRYGEAVELNEEPEGINIAHVSDTRIYPSCNHCKWAWRFHQSGFNMNLECWHPVAIAAQKPAHRVAGMPVSVMRADPGGCGIPGNWREEHKHG